MEGAHEARIENLDALIVEGLSVLLEAQRAFILELIDHLYKKSCNPPVYMVAYPLGRDNGNGGGAEDCPDNGGLCAFGETQIVWQNLEE